MTARRTSQALLSSAAGVQRLVRTAPNKLNRITLIPREPLQAWPPTVVDWFDGVWMLDVHGSAQWHVRIDDVVVGDGLHELEHQTRLLLGATPATLELQQQSWPVDLERERALVTRDDDASWQVYVDELLEKNDPLGPFFTERKSEDVGWLLEVRPLLAAQRVQVEARPQRPWHVVRVQHELFAGTLHEGVLTAVLEHPFAWFVKEVRFALSPADTDFDDAFRQQAATALRHVERCAGPHLQRVVFEGRRAALPSAHRPDLRVMSDEP